MMNNIKDQALHTKGFIILLSLIVILFKSSGSIIMKDWSWFIVLILPLLGLLGSEYYFTQFVKKAKNRIDLKNQFKF